MSLLPSLNLFHSVSSHDRRLSSVGSSADLSSCAIVCSRVSAAAAWPARAGRGGHTAASRVVAMIFVFMATMAVTRDRL